MDQRLLYERLVSNGGLAVDESAALVKRDRYVVDDIRRRFGVDGAIRIAELSIGDGRLTMTMLDNLPNAYLTCADISKARIELAREKIKGKSLTSEKMPTFIQCNFDTEFDRVPTGYFDVVVALDILEHVLDVFSFMDHCRRICKDAGVLYLRTPNIAYLKHRINLFIGRMPVTASWFETPGELSAWRLKHGWDGGHLHLFTLPILRKLVEESAFHVEHCSDPGTRLAALRTLWRNLLLANPLIVAQKKL